MSAPVGVKLPDVPFAVFDEFGVGADDRIMDYGRACAAAAIAQQPAVFRNDGNSEARHVAHHAYACTACGGSGHKADQQPAAEYADADALIAYLDSLCDESDEKWDVAQDAIAGIRAGQQQGGTQE